MNSNIILFEKIDILIIYNNDSNIGYLKHPTMTEIAEVKVESNAVESVFDYDFSVLFKNPSSAMIQRFIGDVYSNGIMPNLKKKEEWYRSAADSGDAQAQYILWNEVCEEEEGLKYLKMSAENGYVEAQYKMSTFSDPIKWLTLAAEQGHVEATYRLAVTYYQLFESGEFKSDEDARNAFKLFTKYIDLTVPESRYAFAHDAMASLYRRWNVANESKVLYHLEMAVELFVKHKCKYNRNVLSKEEQPKEYNNMCFVGIYTWLGDMYFSGIGTVQDYKKAYENYLAVEKSYSYQYNNKTMYQLYLMNRDGLGTEKNPDKAHEYLVASADTAYPDAKYQLAMTLLAKIDKEYHTPLRFYKDKQQEETIEDLINTIIRLLATPTHVNSCVQLGVVYLMFKKDYANCHFYWTKAKELTILNQRADVNYYLAIMYQEGLGVEKDYEYSIELYRTFLELYKGEDLKIGWHEDHGLKVVLQHFDYDIETVKENPEKAFRCCTILVQHNNITAQFILSWLLWNGLGTEKKETEALQWYYKALLADKTDELKGIRQELKSYENEVVVKKMMQIEESKAKQSNTFKSEIESSKQQIEDLMNQLKMLTSTVSSIKKKQEDKEIIYESDSEM